MLTATWLLTISRQTNNTFSYVKNQRDHIHCDQRRNDQNEDRTIYLKTGPPQITDEKYSYSKNSKSKDKNIQILTKTNEL